MDPQLMAEMFEKQKARTDEIFNRSEPKIGFGDLYMLDREDLGIDFFHKSDHHKVMFLNQGGELKLLELLLKKYPQGRESPNVLAGLRNPPRN
jgi:hypothetical protein